jgi:ATP-dependent RNA circularization protein (DNA/RNA ligase family)
MKEYHKITTLFKRDPKNMKYVLEGEFALPEFEWLKDNKWVWTEKVDGTNVRVMWNGTAVTFNGKTDNAQMPVNLMIKLQSLFDTTPQRKLFRDTFTTEDTNPIEVCFYGEGYGAKIQKGGGNYKKDDVDFVLFDIKVGEWWLQRKDVEELAVKFGVKIVPIVGEGSLTKAAELVKSGLESQWGNFEAEGLVCRPEVELRTRRGDRLITKIKSRDFKKD